MSSMFTVVLRVVLCCKQERHAKETEERLITYLLLLFLLAERYIGRCFPLKCPIYQWSSLGRWWKWFQRSEIGFIKCLLWLVCSVLHRVIVANCDRTHVTDLSWTVEQSRWGSLWFWIGELYCKLKAQRQVSCHEEAANRHSRSNKRLKVCDLQ